MFGKASLRVVVVLAVVVTACWSARGAAYATKTVKIASHLSIAGKGLTFSGKVTSPNSACKFGRHVTLHRTNGNVLGSVTTGSSGKWKITASGSAGITLGHFYSTVAKTSQGTAGTIYVCKAARSRTIAYHP